MNVGMGDIVTLHLAAVGGAASDDDGPASTEATAVGISDVLGFDDRGMAGRVTLLSTLDDLQREGLVEEREVAIAGMQGDRVVYALTEEGRRHAESVREQVSDRTVRIRNGEETEIPLSEVDRFVAPPALPRALARMTDDGILYVEQAGEEFVDRDEELAALEATLEADGDQTTVLVSGEAGVGKTTLVTDRFADSATDGGFRVVVGTCRADASQPYAPFEDVLEELTGDPDLVDPDRPGSDLDDADEYGAERTAMFESVEERLAESATDDPLVVVIEDLHLAGDPTVALFEHLAEHLTGPVVLVGTYRPEDLPEDHPVSDLLANWPDDGDSRLHVTLEPFELEDTRRLIERVANRPNVALEFAGVIHDRTGGNPLFVEETVARAIEEGVADPANDVFPTDPEALPLTDSVEGAVDLRLGVLDDASEQVLRAAAVIGQTVPEDILAEVVDLPPTELRTHVDLLVDARILERTDEDTLRFVSGLVRETCANRAPEEDRRDLHARIADAYEEVWSDDPDRHAAIAFHCREAGHADDAFEAYREAGDRAVDVFAAESAREAYEAALSIARENPDVEGGDEDILAVMESLARADYYSDEWDDADQRLKYVAEHTDYDDQRRRVAQERARLWRERGDYVTALEAIEGALDEVGVEESRESASLYGMLGFLQGKCGEYEAAEEAYDRALDIAQRLSDEDLREGLTHEEFLATIEHNRAGLDLERGTVDEETIDIYKRAVERSRDDDDRQNVAISLLNLGIAYQEYGDLDAAEDALRETIEILDDLEIENMVCDARNTLGSILSQAGRNEDAIEQYEKALETAREVDNERIVIYTNGNIGEIRFGWGELDAAVERTSRAREVAEEVGNPHFWTLFTVARARQALLRDRPEEAASLAVDARETAHEVGLEDEARMAIGVHGDVDRVRGDIDRAEERYEHVLEELADDDRSELSEHDGLEPTDGSAIAYHGLARVHQQRGEFDAAVEAAETSLSIARGTIHDDEVVRALAALGAALRDRGDLSDAERRLDEAIDLAEKTGWQVRGWTAEYEKALLAQERDDEDTATELLESLRDEAADGGADLLARRAEEAL